MQSSVGLTLSSPSSPPLGRFGAPKHICCSFGNSQPIKLMPQAAKSLVRANSLAFNYRSPFSVFPAEACETIGGDTCLADMYPEVKFVGNNDGLEPKTPASEPFDTTLITVLIPKQSCLVRLVMFWEESSVNALTRWEFARLLNDNYEINPI